MFDNPLEDRLRANAGTLFEQDKELPAGHRERFEQRLKTANAEAIRQSGKVAAWKTRFIATAAAAAVLTGFVFLLNPFAGEQASTELADVRNYYSMLLEEQVEATRQLIQQVDETNREILFTDVELIENDPIPDVQITDDEYIILVANFYTNKIEILQDMQNIIIATASNFY